MSKQFLPSAPPVSRENTADLVINCQNFESKPDDAIVSRPRCRNVILRELRATHYLNKLVERERNGQNTYFGYYLELLDGYAYNVRNREEESRHLYAYISALKEYENSEMRYPNYYNARNTPAKKYVEALFNFKDDYTLTMVVEVVNQILSVIKDF